jgi:HAMP domain-containing protein
VPGAAGTWKDLTDNVNQLAANLTTQVRAIAEVATAVTQGDLTRSIQVQVQGELEELKNNINEMIRNLKETTLKNAEQDWLKGNLARFTRMLQGQRDLLAVGRMILSELAPLVGAKHGVFYIVADGGGRAAAAAARELRVPGRKSVSNEFQLGEGLVGQAAVEKQRILLTKVPTDYIHISSGLGQAAPFNIVVLPVLFEGDVKAVMELASFEGFSPTHLTFLEQLTESIGIVLTRSRPTRGPRTCCASRSRSPASCRASSASCSSRTTSSRRRRGCWWCRTSRSSARTRRSSRRARRSRRRRPARAHLEVQVRVPGEHVARAQDAAQQPADPRRPPGRRTSRATSTRARSSSRRRSSPPARPAHADQRHPRPVEDRVGHRDRRAGRGAVLRPRGLDRPLVPPHGRGQEPRSSR